MEEMKGKFKVNLENVQTKVATAIYKIENQIRKDGIKNVINLIDDMNTKASVISAIATKPVDNEEVRAFMQTPKGLLIILEQFVTADGKPIQEDQLIDLGIKNIENISKKIVEQMQKNNKKEEEKNEK